MELAINFITKQHKNNVMICIQMYIKNTISGKLILFYCHQAVKPIINTCKTNLQKSFW